ncbi:MAG: arylsulfatase [Bryobacterales bacterium]|nr:arylsulfatase [Bryobacterales bacterium]
MDYFSKTGVGLTRRSTIFGAMGLLGTLGAARLHGQSQRPNIIVILADDLGIGDLGSYGQKRIRTPNLDRMAAEGMRFTQAYAGSSVCAPSRCCLMTGLHNGHGRVRDNVPHGVFLRPDDFTVAELLKQAGYRTCALGKWSLGSPGSLGLPWMQGFDEFFGYLDQDHAHNYYPEFLWDNGREVLQPGNRANQRKAYSPGLLEERALRFIDANAARPFFLYFALTLPHWSDYSRQTVLSQDIPSDEPYRGETWPQVEKNYAAMVTMLDSQVGRILERVRSLGIEQNTLLLFTSDNGPSAEALHEPAFFESGGPYRGVKRELYEGSIRVPLIAQWRGRIEAGSVSEEVCAFWDLLPTAAELAGLPLPDRTDGISLMPAFLKQNRRQHEYLYWDYGHSRPKYSQALRKGRWKAVRNSAASPMELYDLDRDPGEKNNLAPAHPGVVEELAALMNRAMVPSPDYPIADHRSAG